METLLKKMLSELISGKELIFHGASVTRVKVVNSKESDYEFILTHKKGMAPSLRMPFPGETEFDEAEIIIFSEEDLKVSREEDGTIIQVGENITITQEGTYVYTPRERTKRIMLTLPIKRKCSGCDDLE